MICFTYSNSVVGQMQNVLDLDSVHLLGETLSFPVVNKKGLIDFSFSNSFWITDFVNNGTIN